MAALPLDHQVSSTIRSIAHASSSLSRLAIPVRARRGHIRIRHGRGRDVGRVLARMSWCYRRVADALSALALGAFVQELSQSMLRVPVDSLVLQCLGLAHGGGRSSSS